MRYVLSLTLATFVSMAAAQNPTGKWLDTTKDTQSNKYTFVSDGDIVLTEDFEVLQTHEICASVSGYFMNKSQLGRYNVNFRGMRTSAVFTFTTQYAAEKWVEKWCTAESLLQIKGGKGTFARNY